MCEAVRGGEVGDDEAGDSAGYCAANCGRGVLMGLDLDEQLFFFTTISSARGAVCRTTHPRWTEI